MPSSVMDFFKLGLGFRVPVIPKGPRYLNIIYLAKTFTMIASTQGQVPDYWVLGPCGCRLFQVRLLLRTIGA